MRSPEQLRERLRIRWARRRGDWLEGGDWPLALPIAPPSEAEAQRHWPHFRQWLACWRDFDGPGRIEWQDRRWPRLGTQALPSRWLLMTPEEAAEALAEGARWRRAARRYGDLSARWPGHPALRERLRRGFDTLADLPDLDFERLLSTVDWLFRHPDSGLFARQLPIAGLDSKWLEAHRGVVADWLLALRARADDASASSLENDFHRITGLRPKPDLLRLRLLDPALRARLGGLDDVTAPASSIAALHLPIRRALVVENLATGLALHDLPGTVAFMALGYAVDALARIDWLRDLPIVYWGDLDSHGFAILDRLRAHLPQARSLLMDEATLLAHRDFWVQEARPRAAERLARLNEPEHALYDALRQGRHGERIRLEQERIAWDYAWPRTVAACEVGGSASGAFAGSR